MSILAILLIACCIAVPGSAQKKRKADSTMVLSEVPVIRDSVYVADSLRHRQIKKATIRSAIIPGWGQITNRQAWKVPIVYAAVGIPAYLFFFNLDQYKELKNAYIIVSDGDPTNDDQLPDYLKPLSPNSIKFYRDEYRRNVDYSALAFIIAWGLQVVDAAVFANLRDFDVGDKISLQVNPGFNPISRTPQVGLVVKTLAKKQIPKTIYTR